jgi:riboflavin synthase
MFSGIVEELGTITRNGIADDGRLVVACSGVLAGVKVGDSIAVNGCSSRWSRTPRRGLRRT